MPKKYTKAELEYWKNRYAKSITQVYNKGFLSKDQKNKLIRKLKKA